MCNFLSVLHELPWPRWKLLSAPALCKHPSTKTAGGTVLCLWVFGVINVTASRHQLSARHLLYLLPKQQWVSLPSHPGASHLSHHYSLSLSPSPHISDRCWSYPMIQTEGGDHFKVCIIITIPIGSSITSNGRNNIMPESGHCVMSGTRKQWDQFWTLCN